VPAKFVVKKGSTGKYRFNLVATNGQVIATSEAYESRAKALAGIESVRKNAAGAVLVDGTAPAEKPAARKPAVKAAARPATKSPAKAATRPATKTATKVVKAVKKAVGAK
jgi:hypothetical protein